MLKRSIGKKSSTVKKLETEKQTAPYIAGQDTFNSSRLSFQHPAPNSEGVFTLARPATATALWAFTQARRTLASVAGERASVNEPKKSS